MFGGGHTQSPVGWRFPRNRFAVFSKHLIRRTKTQLKKRRPRSAWRQMRGLLTPNHFVNERSGAMLAKNILPGKSSPQVFEHLETNSFPNITDLIRHAFGALLP